MDAVSVQDANKIRVAMGLAPLPVPGEDAGLSFKGKNDSSDASDSDGNDKISTLEKRQAAAGDNWMKLEEERKAKLDRQARKEAIRKQRDFAAKNARLEGATLGDAAEGEMDTKTWLLQQKKRQKQIEKARKYEEEQAAREQQAEYTSKDLAGLKVGHEMDTFGDDGEQILTLKDAAIGEEDEEDELENADLLEREKLKERLELKKKKPVYDPNEINEDGERAILQQYDEEIGGKKRKRFTLNDQGGSTQVVGAEDGADRKSKGVKISLDLLKDETPVSDYAEATTTKVKKPRKKKARTTRQKEVDEDDIFPIEQPQAPVQNKDAAMMDVEGQQTNGTNGSARSNIELDDDDLQRQLAEQRRLTLKKRKKTDAAELARRIREEASATPATSGVDGGEEEEPGMVLDETTEFVANLQRPTAADEKPERQSAPSALKPSADSPEPDEEGDTTMAEALNENDAIDPSQTKRETSTPAAPGPVTSTGFDEEESIDQGIGASLGMLRKRGLITDGFATDQNAKDRAREAFLAENRALIADYDIRAREHRERDRKSGKFERMSAREREAYARQQNESREQYLASLQAQHFTRNYKPDVKLQYTDEFGRSMSQKEAFKHLSHQFHGKGSGKQKTEKRLKKIEDEKKRGAMNSLDQSANGGMGRNLGEQARKKGTAGVRLQ